MPMYKVATPVVEELVVSLQPPSQEEPTDDVVLYTDLPTPEEVIEMHAPEEGATQEICFKLNRLPGAEDDDLVVSGDELEVDTKEEKEKDKSKASDKDDGKDGQKVPKKEFLQWIQGYLQKIPKHKGETIALERALSYLKRGLDIISKTVQQDFDGEIDIAKAEDARIVMENGINRLSTELERRKRKANINPELTKEAQKAAGIGVGGVLVTVPILISAIARACINSTISGGKDIEHTFDKLATKFKLSDREKIEVIQLLTDMNFPFRRDLFLVDDKDPYRISSENNVNYPPNYQA